MNLTNMVERPKERISFLTANGPELVEVCICVEILLNLVF